MGSTGVKACVSFLFLHVCFYIMEKNHIALRLLVTFLFSRTIEMLPFWAEGPTFPPLIRARNEVWVLTSSPALSTSGSVWMLSLIPSGGGFFSSTSSPLATVLHLGNAFHQGHQETFPGAGDTWADPWRVSMVSPVKGIGNSMKHFLGKRKRPWPPQEPHVNFYIQRVECMFAIENKRRDKDELFPQLGPPQPGPTTAWSHLKGKVTGWWE